MSEAVKNMRIQSVNADGQVAKDDWITVEEPMEIRVVTGPPDKRRGRGVSITMRTPGQDHELAIGFLVAEGIIADRAQIQNVESVGTKTSDASNPSDDEAPNTVRVELTPETEVNYEDLRRHFYSNSSCGVCGKASLQALEYQNLKPVESTLTVDSQLINQLPNLLRQNQKVFPLTGGIHAAALFDASGELVTICEDVGRHNAVDKLIGSHFLAGTFPMQQQILVVSARASFELLQKSLSAQIPIFVAVGAPSTLAVDLATQFNVTLVGFASTQRFNIYSSPKRIR